MGFENNAHQLSVIIIRTSVAFCHQICFTSISVIWISAKNPTCSWHNSRRVTSCQLRDAISVFIVIPGVQLYILLHFLPWHNTGFMPFNQVSDSTDDAWPYIRCLPSNKAIEVICSVCRHTKYLNWNKIWYYEDVMTSCHVFSHTFKVYPIIMITGNLSHVAVVVKWLI